MMKNYYPEDDFNRPSDELESPRIPKSKTGAGYFHPNMNAWTRHEQTRARQLDEIAWRRLDEMTRDEKNDMGHRRQKSLELARFQLGRWPRETTLPEHLRMYASNTMKAEDVIYNGSNYYHPPLSSTPKGKTTMRQTVNPSLAVFLINREVRGVMCAYDFEDDKHTKPLHGKTYLFKTLDQSIQKGDLVVVPTSTRVGFTVVKVIDIDVEPDYNSDIDYKWVVSKLDTSTYDGLIKKEEAGKQAIREAEKLAARNELKEKLFQFNEEKLKALPLYKNGNTTPAVEVPLNNVADEEKK